MKTEQQEIYQLIERIADLKKQKFIEESKKALEPVLKYALQKSFGNPSRTVTKRAEVGENKERLLNYVSSATADAGINRADAVQALGISTGTFNYNMRELKKKGLVSQVGTKRWARYFPKSASKNGRSIKRQTINR